MLFLLMGVLFLTAKYLEIDPVAAWSWWVIFTPFGLAVVWWYWADATGYTKRKAMERENQRKQDRINKNKEAIGTLSASKKRR